jgi:hypothetical protein
MRNRPLTATRIACIGWGPLQFSDSVWFYAGDYALLRGVYSNASTVALLILGMALAKMWSNSIGALALTGIALVGFFRAIQMLLTDLSTSGGFDLSSTLVQLVGVGLLLMMVLVGKAATLDRARP